MRELGSGSRGRIYCQYRDFSVPNFDTPLGPPRREGGVSNIMVLLLAPKENAQQGPEGSQCSVTTLRSGHDTWPPREVCSTKVGSLRARSQVMHRIGSRG